MFGPPEGGYFSKLNCSKRLSSASYDPKSPSPKLEPTTNQNRLGNGKYGPMHDFSSENCPFTSRRWNEACPVTSTRTTLSPCQLSPVRLPYFHEAKEVGRPDHSGQFHVPEGYAQLKDWTNNLIWGDDKLILSLFRKKLLC